MVWKWVFIALVVCTVVFAAQQAQRAGGSQAADRGQGNGQPFENTSSTSTVNRTQENASWSSGNQIREQQRVAEQARAQLQLLNRTNFSDAGNSTQRARIAVRAMQQIGNASGTCNDLCVYAQQLQLSEQVTMQAEQRIQERSRFARFLFGGDTVAAQSLSQAVVANQQRLGRLGVLVNETNDSQTRLALQEMYGELEREQLRLSQLASQEQSRTGLFGWIWR